MLKFFKIFNFFDKQIRKKIYFYISLSVFNSITEVLAVFSMIPLLDYVLDGSQNFSNQIIDVIISHFTINDIFTSLLIIIAISFFFKLVVNLLLSYYHEHLICFLQINYSNLIVNNYTKQDYKIFLTNTSSVFFRNLKIEIPRFIVGCLGALLNLFSDITVLILIFISILIINIKIGIFILIFFLIILLFSFSVSKQYIAKLSKNMQKYDGNRVKLILNLIDNFKIIKILSKENFFLKKFDNAVSGSFNSIKKYQFFVRLPRIFLEFFVITAILLSMVFFDTKEALITLAIVASFSIKLIPTISRIFGQLQAVNYNFSAFEELEYDLTENNFTASNNNFSTANNNHFNSLEFKNVSYSYDENNAIFEDLSFKITRNEFVGIVGESGSGKSTLIDLLAGLLEPTKGIIELNNVKIEKKSKLIKKFCGYMPQTISFLEGTVAENIAFGVEKELINLTKVKECLFQSEISYFLNQEDFLTSDIKEKGVNFSGGEKQRLALARTLYHDPEIIILDESTSAMDEELEEKILQTIKNLKDKTIIFITHKKKNLKLCDKVISLDKRK